jgi:type I restriction-modification system DNA methylase subunit
MNATSFKALLKHLNFEETDTKNQVFSKYFPSLKSYLKVNFKDETLIYPEDKGLLINERQTCNFSQNENFVVFECVYRLLEKGYNPQHIELEPKWKVGRGASGGRADILVKNQLLKPLLIIECKTAGREFVKAWKETEDDGGQLFSYAQQISETEFLCLYASSFNEKENEIEVSQYIISHTDNPKILEESKELLSFEKAANVKSRFKAWKETYKLEKTTKGIFENNIPAYQIGKNKYTIEDLGNVTRKDVSTKDDGKYHKFRTILRKHNVSGRERAFDILVNLFLCKIVDETQNPQDLSFYWKGIAYDNYFDFVDRLQGLYKEGMEKYLGEEITYISNQQIEDAFWAIKQRPNATKEQIQKYFKELKFFTNNDFAFIDVYNKKLFDKNIKVLLEIVEMWQDLRLKTNTQNQFLGDMFEYFLDNGIKQSEGQFFTPIPITRFICTCLPLEDIIQNQLELPKIIDYACGSGHFLTEIATQIQPFVTKYKQMEGNQIYQNIFGIEKESRLSKVAKVSAFMYGQEGINVFAHDALDDFEKVKNAEEIKENNFDILVANPPFAVEDFLETLPEQAQESYTLFKNISNSGSNNIQCFFLERAKQLLAPNGVAGIIVPSSILSNSDSTHIATREILLKFFDFVSIVELGSGTFGKTGTNTVVLFLQRKAQRPEQSEHYENRVINFFENWEEELETQGGVYKDINAVKNYCSHIDIPFEDYQNVLQNDFSMFLENLSKLLEFEIFKDYKNDFESSTIIKNVKTKKIFKDKSKEEQQHELNKKLFSYIREIEKDKLYYFLLAFYNPTKVLLVKSPNDNKEQKQFLGYEWSNAKGNEGIKYNTDNEGNHKTPLYDPINRDNTEKISYAISQNFLQKPVKELPEHCMYASLTDILDFSRKDFDKAFSLTPKKSIQVDTKWELVKLGDLAEIISGGTPKSEVKDYWNGHVNWATLVDSKEKYITSTKRKITQAGLNNSSATLLPINTVIFSSRATIGNVSIAKVETATNQGFKNFICNERINYEFLYEMLRRYSNFIEEIASGMTYKEISKTEISNFKIPLPPKDIQQKIVNECEKIDTESREAEQKIEESKREIENMVLDDFLPKTFLENILEKISTNIDPTTLEGEVNYIGLENIESNTSNLVGETKTEYSTIKSTKIVFQETDILYGKLRPNLNKVYVAKEKGICSTDILVFRLHQIVFNKFYLHYFLSEDFNEKVLKTVSGQQLPRTSWNKMNKILVPQLDIAVHKNLVLEIEKLEEKINTSQKIIDSSSERKQEVMEKYL